MTNISDLLKRQPEFHDILKTAGNLSDRMQIKAFVVGGVVRDVFLKRELTEIDIMVVGNGIEFARKLSSLIYSGKIVPFEAFNTARIPSKPVEVEIASARKEKYSKGSRKPATVEGTDLEGDLVRRDFRVNAMAVSLNSGSFGDLYDPLGGMTDLMSRTLVTPLDPDETFSDDPLRMMRAAYFASGLNFKIDRECLTSIKRQADRIGIVSWERISAEFIKILRTPVPSKGLIILQETGIMKLIMPEIDTLYGMDQTPEWHHKDIFYHTMQVVDNAAMLTDSMEIRFAALVHDIAKPHTRRVDPEKGYTFHGHDDVGGRMIRKLAKRMKLSNDLADYLRTMTQLHLRPIALAKKSVTDSAVRRLMVAAGEHVDDLMILCRADITSKNPRQVKKYLGNFERVEKRMQDVEERDQLRAFQSPVRGEEIMEVCGLSPGPEVGRIKSILEEAILDGIIKNSHDETLAYLLKIKDKTVQKQNSKT